jgi:capsular polysaccharide biosynthesis protein
MISVPTVDITALCPPGDAHLVLRDWRGFVEYLPGERCRTGRAMCVLDNKTDARWRWIKQPRAMMLRPLGCFFLRDIDICGSGYFFSEGRFVREYSHTSDVALQWLQSEDCSDNPFVKPPQREVRIEQPVLLVIGPGSPIYGHWLVDFLPRLAIAQRLLGSSLADFIIPLPEDTPDWVPQMIRHFCGIEATQLRRFKREVERLVCKYVCVPSFAHTGDYALHSFLDRFYNASRPAVAPAAGRKICLSRRNFEASTRGVRRVFETRLAFEALAAGRGYEVVCPEDLTFAEQIDLFQSASAIIGEHGSGMHGAIFAGADTKVACFPMTNAVQYRIGALRAHTNVYLNRLVWQTDEQGVTYFSAAEQDLIDMMTVVDSLG